MGPWTLLLLHLPLVVSMLPAPTNVSIVSFNLEHTLTWLPGPGTPDNTHFTVQSLRKNSWQLVKGCARLKTRQSCDLTNTFKDPFYHYKARVQAITTTQKSNWSLSMLFYPLTDTLLGPPVVSVSGCGNCLLLQVTPPTSRGLQRSLSPTQLYYRQFTCKVRRTRDGSQEHTVWFVFEETASCSEKKYAYTDSGGGVSSPHLFFSMWVTSTEKTVIGYLEPGAEYCVTVTPSTSFNPHSVPSEPHCAFTSPTAANTVPVVLSVLCAFSLLVVLLCGIVVYSGRLLCMHKPLPKTLSSVPLCGGWMPTDP